MRLSEKIAELRALAEDGYYASTHAGMPDADYVGYAYKRHDIPLGAKEFPYDRDRDGDSQQTGRDRSSGDREPMVSPFVAKQKGVTKKSGFEEGSKMTGIQKLFAWVDSRSPKREAAGTPVNQTIGSRGGSQTGNPAGGMGGSWANSPTKPWDENDEDLEKQMAIYGKDALESREVVPVSEVPETDPPLGLDSEPPEGADFDAFPSAIVQVVGSGFGTGLGHTNPSGRGFMDGWTEELDVIAAESAWAKITEILMSLTGQQLPESVWTEALQMAEAPYDDEGQPLRSSDPFAPPVKHKAVGSSPGSAGVFQKSQQRSAPSPSAAPPPESRKIAPQAKPQYPGKYVGQTQTTNGQVDYKKVSWQDRNDPEKRGFGRVPSMQKVTLVWDGNDWISQQEFDHKARTGQLRRK